MLRFICFLISTPLHLYSQSTQLPIQWDYEVVTTDVKHSNIIIAASVINNWHLYSQYSPSDSPTATQIKFSESDDYKLIGHTAENGTAIWFNDTTTETNGYVYYKYVEFLQSIERNRIGTFTIEACINFVACSEEECIPSRKILLITVN